MTERGMRLEVAFGQEDEHGEIRVLGEFDRLQVERFDRVSAGLTSTLHSFTVDLTATTIIDSAALGSLIRLRHALDAVDSSLSVLVSKPFQITVMRVGGLYDYLSVTVVDSND